MDFTTSYTVQNVAM